MKAHVLFPVLHYCYDSHHVLRLVVGLVADLRISQSSVAVYKNPDYIFLDEATNSLDANNERSIVENLDKFYKGKTVVIVAHRLSTVKNADQIVVIDHGKVVEVGNHESLTAKRGAYYNLVKNQLELGN